MRTTLTALPLSLLLAALPAQDKSPYRFVPADANFVLRFAAPAKWQKQFAAAQITKLFSSQTLAPMVGMMKQGYQQMLDEVRAEGDIDADLIDGLMTGYAGDIVIGVKVDLSNLEGMMQSGETPSFECVISLAPDGSYDLAKLAAEIEKAADKNTPSSGKVRDLTVGTVKTRLLDNDGDEPDMTLPTMIDGHLVAFFGNDVEPQVTRALGTGARYQGSADGAMHVHMELGSVMKAITSIAGMAMDMQGASFDAAQMLRDLGLESMTHFTMSLGSEGQHLVGEYELGLTEGNRGLMAAFTHTRGGAPKLLRYLPANAETFSIGTFDPNPVYETVAKIWKAMGEEAPMSWDDAMAAFSENMKVRLKEDVIDHLGDEFLMLQDAEAAVTGAKEAEEDDNPMAALKGTCLGMGLRNGKAFQESLEKILRANGMHAARKTEDYQGNKVSRLALGGVLEVEYAITDDILLLAVGSDESGRRALRSVLDARATGDGELPANIKAVTSALPAGWTGIGSTSMTTMLNTIAKAMEQDENLPDEAQMAVGMMKGIGDELKRLGIDKMVSAAYASARGMTARFRW